MIGRVLFYLSMVICVYAGLTSGLTAAYAQSTAMLQGRVDDQNGAVIRGARVTARSLATNVERFGETDPQGNYQIAALPVGHYRVEALEEMLTPVRKATQGSIILYVRYSQDEAGKTLGPREILALVTQSSSVPIYGLADGFVGHGIVGGYVFRQLAAGKRLGEMALQIANGTRPADSVVRFKDPSLWQQYKWRIVGVISLFILEAVLIVGLLINRARRKQAQRETERFAELAKVDHRRLEEVVSNVPGMVWEISIDPASGERETQFVSRFVEEMLGYSAEDFIATKGFGLSLIPAEDRARVERETNAIFASGKSGTLQYRWLTKDGRLIWVEAQLAVMRDEHDRPVGLRGVTMEVTARKLGEEALRESDARNRDILRALPDVMFLQSADGMYLDFHAKEPGKLFVSPEHFLGKNMRDVLPPELAEEFFGCFRRALETDEPQIVEYALTLQNKQRWFEARIVRSKDNQMLSLVRDVTDRRLAEEGEQRSEERFAKSFKANPQPMSLTTLAEGRYVDVNDSFLTMSGYTREEVIGRTSLELRIWETPEARVDFMQPLKERGAIHNLETKFRTKSGSFRLLLSSAEQFELGGETCVLVASSDITERYRALEELRQSEERFRNMADSAPVLIWIAGPDNLCTYVNHSWLEFTGRTIDQELGNGWIEGVHREDSTRCLEVYKSAFDRHAEFEMEYRLRRADGVFRWIYDIGTPRFSSDGEFLGYIGSCLDIADRKEAEETLRDLGGRLINAQEEERSRVARELHDNISQRIAVLSIGLEQVGQQILAGAGNLHSRIQSLSAETQEISTELHRVSYQLHPSKLDHLGLVSAVKSFCGEVGALHGLPIKFRQEGFPAQLSKDITLCLFRIVQEALHNAAKHSGAPAVQVLLEKTDQSVRLTVSDTGCGFDTESSKMTSGLGFVSMRERLRLVGGQLSIHSRPSEGTQIEVTVPLTQAEVQSARTKTTTA